MRLEKLNLSNSKGKIRLVYLSGFITAVALIILVNIIASKALYRKTESVQLASGTINYTPYDFKIMAMYQEKENHENENDKYEEINIMPGSEYVINESKSYCTLDNKEHDNKAILKTFEGKHIISNLTKQDKCYLYFDRETSSASKTVFNLGLKTEGAIDNITGPSCSSGCKMNENGLYYAGEDDDGPSYVFRGTVDNNWVKFGQTSTGDDIWWRIIRINGNGTIRLIYAGVGNEATVGNGTNALNNIEYNTNKNDNTYVGYYYSSTSQSTYDETHTNATKSTIAGKVDEWFTETTKLSKEYINYIDENAGFCNDRRKSIVTHGYPKYTNKGYGKEPTYYAPFDRVATSDSSDGFSTTEQKPTLKCGMKIEDEDYQRDYYTWNEHATRGNKILEQPVGLITMDEVILAGGFGAQNNTGYWLYTGEYYWTMSPYLFNGNDAHVGRVDNNGSIANSIVSNSATPGVRPVINLKADSLTLQNTVGDNKGTTTNPYVVKIN